MSAEPAPSVLVTGAGVGIGYALARSFALSGSRVALNDLEPALAQRAADAINTEARADRVVPYGLDVADVPAVRRMVADADERFGGLHIAIANAFLNALHPRAAWDTMKTAGGSLPPAQYPMVEEDGHDHRRAKGAQTG